MNDYIESLFQGVDILIDKKLEGLAYDTTVICTITDSTNSKNGIYRVTDGSASYIVYSDQDNYREGEQVRVNIPQGDYSQKKFIIGKYAKDDEITPITYISPLESVVNISGNLLSDKASAKEYGIIANGSMTKKIIWNQSLPAEKFRNLQADGIYNTLILKADFKTRLPYTNTNYITTGTYGLRIDLLVKPSIDSNAYIRRSVELSCEEMFGNPYNFTIFSPQEKTFNITTVGIIEGIELSLYQNNNFVNNENQALDASKNLIEDILIKNIELGFGSNVRDIEDNAVIIYSENDAIYNYSPHTDTTNKKKIGLIWYNKDVNNKYIGFSDGVYDLDYNELDHIKDSQTDLRLTSRKGRLNIPEDEQGLTFAANIEEAIPILYKVSSMLTQDLCGELNYFADLSGDDKKVYEDLADDLTDIAGWLRDESDEDHQYIKKLQDLYTDILTYVYTKINTENFTDESPSITNYFQTIFNTINNGIGCSNYDECLDWVKTSIENWTCSSALMDIKQNSLSRIEYVIKKIYAMINTLPETMKSDYSKFQQYMDQNVSDYIPYAEQDFSEDANKYSIYWYRYQEGYVEPGDDAIKLMPDGWRRINPNDPEGTGTEESKSYNPFPNKKVDSSGNAILNENGKETYDIAVEDDQGFIYPYMKNDLLEEKFVALVCYDHSIYKSNELVFTNNQSVPDLTTLNKNDVLKFEHGENSSDSYLIYNDLYYLRDTADEHKERTIKCYYEGRGESFNEETILDGATIYWYIPTNSTMLNYDTEVLEEKNFYTDSGVNNLVYSKAGYTCFYKQISKDTLDIDREFYYKVKSYYEPIANQNHILCRIVAKNDIEKVESGVYFTFGIAGTNGTKYTLAITNSTSQCAVTSSNDLKLTAVLKNANNEAISFKSNEPSVSWYMHTVSSNNLNCSGQDITIGHHDGCGILEVSVSTTIDSEGETATDKTKLVNLKYLHAVPWSAGKYYLSGSTYVIYDNFGTLNKQSMFDNPYKLYNGDDHSEVDVSWDIEYYISSKSGWVKKSLSELDNVQKNYVPVINKNNGLTPSSLYIENLNCIPVVVAKKGSNPLWRQPIIITQNRYASPLLNDWDGSFKIDEDNGTILSTMLGAGRKNSNNTFDGVLMGNVSAAKTGKTGIGLYGFNDGAQSFGLNVDGTAFFGKSGSGRINFDGNTGTITSANYTKNTGMKINLENGFIDAYNFKLTSKHVTIDSSRPIIDEKDGTIHNDSNTTYFKIEGFPKDADGEMNKGEKDANLTTLISIGSGESYLKSANYSTTKGSEAGMKISLDKGLIDAYNFKLTSKHVTIDSTDEATAYLKVVKIIPAEKEGEDDTEEILLYVGDSDQYLRSPEDTIKINLSDGSLTGSNFKLEAGAESTGKITLNSAGSTLFYVGKQLSEKAADGTEKTWNNFIKLASDGLTIETKKFSLKDGEITATGGKIAGWTIDAQWLHCETYFKDGSRVTSESEANIYYSTFMKNLSSSGATSEAAFGVYKYTKNKEGNWDKHLNFYVTHAGKLNATGAYIQGEIHASTGVFKGTVYASSGTFSGTISASNINTSTINGVTMSNSSVTDSSVSGGSVSNSSVSGGSVTGAKIVNGSITMGTESVATFKINTDTPHLEMSVKNDFLALGGVTDRPRVSGLNVGEGGINFRSGLKVNSAGTSYGTISSTASKSLHFQCSGDFWIDVSGAIRVGASGSSVTGMTGNFVVGSYRYKFIKGLYIGSEYVEGLS